MVDESKFHVGAEFKSHIRFAENGVWIRIDGTVAHIGPKQVKIALNECMFVDIFDKRELWLDKDIVRDYLTGAQEEREDAAAFFAFDHAGS
jgi:F0F1-type ATP synthase epsilon subunit